MGNKTNKYASESRSIVNVKEHEISLEVEDRLSCLPDALILHILGFVHTKLAVQTTILSKRWLHLWTYLSSFIFYGPDNYYSFDRFIFPFLIAHNTSSTIHTLICHDLPLCNVTRVIDHVVSRHVQHVDLKHVSPPSSLLACKSLRTLKLYGSFIRLPLLNVPSLNTLCLHDVTFVQPNYPLVNILSICQCVQHLELSYSKGRPIYFYSFKNTQRLMFPSLKKLRLHRVYIITPSYEENENFPFDHFSGFVNLEDLEISYCSIYNSNGLLNISCPHLVNLKLSHVANFNLEEKVKIIVSSPRLTSFKFEMYRSFNRTIDLVLGNTICLQIVDFHVGTIYDCPEICASNKWKEENFPRIVKFFETISSVKSLYLSLDTIKVLSLYTKMLENQICPLDKLEIVKVRAVGSKEVRSSQIPLEVVRYLSSASPNLNWK